MAVCGYVDSTMKYSHKQTWLVIVLVNVLYVTRCVHEWCTNSLSDTPCNGMLVLGGLHCYEPAAQPSPV